VKSLATSRGTRPWGGGGDLVFALALGDELSDALLGVDELERLLLPV